MSNKLTIRTPYHFSFDCKSKKEVLAAWDSGRDFLVADISSRWDGKPINKEDAIRHGITTLNIRYSKDRKVLVHEMPLQVAFAEPIDDRTPCCGCGKPCGTYFCGACR